MPTALRRRLAVVALGAFAAAAPLAVGAQQSSSSSSTAQLAAVTAPVAPETRDGADATVPATALRPGDVVRVRIWREPDLSGEYPVDERGMAVFPRLGPVDVSHVTPDSLQRQLVTAYQVYLRNPSIEVVPLRRVMVGGAVVKPGVFTVDPATTVADVIALAGGVTPQGRPDRVRVMRGTEILRTEAFGSPIVAMDEAKQWRLAFDRVVEAL